jgi:pyruvate dehydrogenase (quinone)
MTRKRVADLLVDTLAAAGVERIYGLAGDSLNGVTDSIRPRDNIKWVPVDVGMTGLLGFSSAKVNLFR